MKKFKLLFICLLMTSTQVFSSPLATPDEYPCDYNAPYNVNSATMCDTYCCLWEQWEETKTCREYWCVDYTSCEWYQTEEKCEYYK